MVRRAKKTILDWQGSDCAQILDLSTPSCSSPCRSKISIFGFGILEFWNLDLGFGLTRKWLCTALRSFNTLVLKPMSVQNGQFKLRPKDRVTDWRFCIGSGDGGGMVYHGVEMSIFNLLSSSPILMMTIKSWNCAISFSEMFIKVSDLEKDSPDFNCGESLVVVFSFSF